MCVPISLQDEYNKFDDPETLADEIVSSDEDMDLGEFSASSGGERPSRGPAPGSLNDIGMGEEGGEAEPEAAPEAPEAGEGGETVSLPSMNDIGMDFTDSTNF